MMKQRSVIPVLLALGLAGCHGAPKADPDTVYLEAEQIRELPGEIKEVRVPVPTPQLRRLPAVAASDDAATTPEHAIADAKDNATQRAKPDDFIQAVQVYDYLPGVVYEVIASPGHVTTIALEPGEQLITKAAGDTAQWFVGDTPGSGDRTLLMVKPLKPNVETNLVVSTDRRLYQIDLKSVPGVYQSEVRWNYPADFARQLIARHHEQVEADKDVLDGDVNLTELDFGYRIQFRGRAKEGEPDWTPRRVFTDGRKTYIGFPENLAVMEAPPLFVLSRKGDTQLVNYRVKGHYYIVDRVIDRAELRLGEAPQEVVTIERTGARRESTVRRSTTHPIHRR